MHAFESSPFSPFPEYHHSDDLEHSRLMALLSGDSVPPSTRSLAGPSPTHPYLVSSPTPAHGVHIGNTVSPFSSIYSTVPQGHFQSGPSPSVQHVSEQHQHLMRVASPTAHVTPFSMGSSQSPLPSGDGMSPAVTASAADSGSPQMSPSGASDQGPSGDLPYSRLIWEALISAEDQMLPLQGIYEWFKLNTTKAQDGTSRGWKNSIRHNLSMNAVCIDLLPFLCPLLLSTPAPSVA